MKHGTQTPVIKNTHTRCRNVLGALPAIDGCCARVHARSTGPNLLNLITRVVAPRALQQQMIARRCIITTIISSSGGIIVLVVVVVVRVVSNALIFMLCVCMLSSIFCWACRILRGLYNSSKMTVLRESRNKYVLGHSSD